MTALDTHRTLTHLIRACDVVFGSTSTLLALLATWRWRTGAAPGGLVLALWAVPAINIAWSLLTKHRDRVRADLIRGLMSAPLAIYIYGAEDRGVLGHMWLPALMLSLASCLSISLGSRKLTGGMVVALVYAVGMFWICRAETAVGHDAVGLLLTDTMVSIVAVQLGRALVESGRRRDEAAAQRTRAELTLEQLGEQTDALTRTLAELNHEMDRRKQMEAELVQAQKLESVGRLAAGIAHEINTPVQFIGDSLQFVRYAVDDLLALVHGAPPDEDLDLAYLTDEVPRALGRANDGLQRVTRIVRSMKVFSHPDAAAMSMSDLNRAIDATLVIAHNEYKYVAELVTDLDPALPLVSCFVSELNQAVLNIVINAAHAIGDANLGAARGTIEIRTRRDGDDVVISIRDTGPGIPEAIRARVFDPFFTTKAVGRGTGQGLSIAHAIVVEKHRGKLWFDTEHGRGTTFYIRIAIAGAPSFVPPADGYQPSSGSLSAAP